MTLGVLGEEGEEDLLVRALMFRIAALTPAPPAVLGP